MKFNDTEAVEAAVHCVDKSGNLKSGLVVSGIFGKICDYLKIRKDRRQNFRTNLFFAWRSNLRGFKTRTIEGVKQKEKKNTKSGPKVRDCHSDEQSSESEGSDESELDSENSDESRIHRKIKHRNYQYVGSFALQNENIFYKERLFFDKLHYILRDQLPDVLNITCTLRFKGHKELNNDRFSDYAVCRQPNGSKYFKIIGDVSKLKISIDVYATPDECDHDESLAYQLRSEERKKLQAKLQFAKPHTVHE